MLNESLFISIPLTLALVTWRQPTWSYRAHHGLHCSYEKNQCYHLGLEGRVLLAGQDNVIKKKNMRLTNNLGWSRKKYSLHLSSVSLKKTRKPEEKKKKNLTLPGNFQSSISLHVRD